MAKSIPSSSKKTALISLAEPKDVPLEDGQSEEMGVLNGLMSRMNRSMRRSQLACANGLRVSAQANEFTYCVPRENDGPYESVELGFPTMAVERWAPWAEEPSVLTETVYGRVPVLAVAYAIAENGGRDEAQTDWEARSSCGDGAVAPESASEASEPLRVLLSDKAGLSRAMLAWAQEATLGSPLAERAARFEVWSGKSLVADWTACMSTFLAAGFEAAAENDPKPWVKALSDRAAIAKATAYPSDQPRPRRTL